MSLRVQTATVAAQTGGAAHPHEHGAAVMPTMQAAHPAPGESVLHCGDCDLGCLAACATVALLGELPELPAQQPAAVAPTARVSATRLPHRLPLFRPPSPTVS